MHTNMHPILKTVQVLEFVDDQYRILRISALALIAARKMGLSAVSRIRDSESVSSVEICTISMDKSAMDRKRFNASILFENYLLNIRRNSSIF